MGLWRNYLNEWFLKRIAPNLIIQRSNFLDIPDALSRSQRKCQIRSHSRFFFSFNQNYSHKTKNGMSL